MAEPRKRRTSKGGTPPRKIVRSTRPSRASAAGRKADSRSPAGLLHELQVHQVEMEAQNEELRKAQVALEEARDRYADLYDFAPVGYLTLRADGRIAAANLTAASMLGVDRAHLGGRGFGRFVARDDLANWESYLGLLRRPGSKPVTELSLVRHDGLPFVGRLIGVRVDGREATAAEPAGEPELHVILSDVSSLRASQEALQESENRFRTLFEQAGDSILVLEIPSDRGPPIIRDVNARTLEIYGWTREELLGQPVSFLDPDPQFPTGNAERLSTLGSAGRAGFATRHRCKDGAIRDFDCAARETQIGSRQYVISVERDVTAARQTEQALRENEAKFRTLIETTATGYLILDLEGRVIDANQEYVRLTGHRTLQEILGRPVTDWTAAWDLERNRTEVAKCIREGFVRDLEVDYCTGGGPAIPIEINATLVQEEGGSRILSLCRDITERRQADRELARSTSLLREMEFLTTAGGWEYEVATRRIAWTEGVYRIYGVEPTFDTNDLGRSLSFYPPESKPVIDAAFARAVEHGEPYDLELPFVRADGERIWVRTSGRPELKDGRVVRVVGNIVDATERKALEQALRNLAARMDAVREEERILLSRELHDNLGQLLAALKLDMAWLEKRAYRGDYREMVDKLRQMWGTADEAVRSVRKLASALRPAILASGGMWAAIEGEAARFATRTGIVCSVQTAKCAKCRADQDLAVAASVVRIVQEALTNVAQHAAARTVTISCRPEQAVHFLCVADNGCGIAPEAIADPRSIGLVGMRERTLSFGGELAIESAAGQGTSVTVRIPVPARPEDA
jgi:PAS domain S-box-containing protein